MEQHMEIEEIVKLNYSINRLFDSFKGTFPKKDIFTKSEFIDAYTLAYNICIKNDDEVDYSRILYDFQNKKLDEYNEILNIRIVNSKSIIEDIVKEYSKYQIINKWFSSFFQYLDRYFIKSNNYDSLKINGMKKFYANIFNKILMNDNILEILFEYINKFRDFKENIILNNIKSFIELCKNDKQIYEFIHGKIIEITSSYYFYKLNHMINDSDNYINEVENIINFEKKNIFNLLEETNDSLVFNIYKTLLYSNYQVLLYNNQFNIKKLLENKNFIKLKQIYLLFEDNRDIFYEIVKSYEEYLDENLEDLIDRYKKLIKKEYMDFFDKFINIYLTNQENINEYFESDKLFHKSLSDIFTKNLSKSIDSETLENYLVQYINKILTKKNKSDVDTSENINNIFLIFKLIRNKDIFINKYQNLLSIRLLNETYSDIEYEKKFLMKLKLECGYSSILKLERMISDYLLHKDNSKKFNDYLNENNIKLPIEFNTKVLTYGNWPKFLDDNLILPPNLVKSQNIFNDYFLETSSSRKLRWFHQYDSIELNAIFESNKYTISCNIYQALVLLLFNDNLNLNKELIMKKTGIEHEVINKILHSLVSKHNLVNFKNDKYSLNNNFKSNLKKLKLLCPNLSYQKKESVVNIDRPIIIESLIVRIMKTRKMISHNELVNELLIQIKNFVPEKSLIKERIESLIERDYIERTDINKYTYLA
jgi:cullin 1